MATTMTLSQLMSAVRQRADMAPAGYTPDLVSNYFVTEPELISYINQSYFELYDLHVSSYGDDYFVAPPVSFTTDGTNSTYSLPNGTLYSSAPAFYKLLGVDVLIQGSTNQWMTLKPFNFAERNRFSPYGVQVLYAYSNLRYRLQGDKIWFTPIPQAGLTIQLWYVPRMTSLAALSDTCEGVSGWTEYIIIDAAIKCLQKEESDVSVLLAQKAAMKQRIEAMAENRDVGSVATVSDTRGMVSGGFSPFGDPFGGM